MRKVVLYELVSLDGVAEAPETFFVDDWDREIDAQLATLIATQDTVILGRRTYDQWSRYWPDSDVEPFATFINNVEKRVATSTPLDGRWQNATAIEVDLVPFVRELKNMSGGDIGVHGSISVARSLLEADAIDEVHLIIAPGVVGGGRRLLEGLPEIRLELVRGSTSSKGYLLAGYRVVR